VRACREELKKGDEPFDVMASASDAFDVAGYQRLAEAGVTHVLTVPWIFSHGNTSDLALKKDGMRRFADEVVSRLS